MASQDDFYADDRKAGEQVSKLPPFLSIADTMRLFRVGRRTVYRWMEVGKVTRYKAGKRVLIDTRSVLRMMQVPGA